MPIERISVRRVPGTPNTNAVELSPGGLLYVEANTDIDQTLTPWVHFLTPIAMRRGVPLHLDGPAAHSGLGATRAAQKVLSSWWDDLSEVKVTADWTEPTPPAPGVGLFFSGGVDSFYSALQHADEVTHFIFVTGFDIGLGKANLAERTLSEIRQIASAMGKELLEARTNVRRLSNKHCSWGKQYHGAALAGIAHMFSPVIGRAIIPSSLSHPWGSDPELDPLWSSTVTIVHDTPASRLEKVTRVAQSQLALDHLRVCYSAKDTEYNCGRCEKCQRTMISLHALGVLDRCRTFPKELDPKAVRKLYLTGGKLTFARENLAKLKEMPARDFELERALGTALALAPRRAAIRRAKRSRQRLVDQTRGLARRARRSVGRALPEAVKAPLRRLPQVTGAKR